MWPPRPPPAWAAASACVRSRCSRCSRRSTDRLAAPDRILPPWLTGTQPVGRRVGRAPRAGGGRAGSGSRSRPGSGSGLQGAEGAGSGAEVGAGAGAASSGGRAPAAAVPRPLGEASWCRVWGASAATLPRAPPPLPLGSEAAAQEEGGAAVGAIADSGLASRAGGGAAVAAVADAASFGPEPPPLPLRATDFGRCLVRRTGEGRRFRSSRTPRLSEVRMAGRRTELGQQQQQQEQGRGDVAAAGAAAD